MLFIKNSTLHTGTVVQKARTIIQVFTEPIFVFKSGCANSLQTEGICLLKYRQWA